MSRCLDVRMSVCTVRRRVHVCIYTHIYIYMHMKPSIDGQ